MFSKICLKCKNILQTNIYNPNKHLLKMSVNLTAKVSKLLLNTLSIKFLIFHVAGWDSTNISYHSAKFGGNMYCGNADIIFFRLSHDHMVKRSHGLGAGVRPMQVTTLSSLVVIDIAEVQM